MKYKVTFEFTIFDPEISDGKWHPDCLDNNGEGFDFEEAEYLACDLRSNTAIACRNVDVTEMEV